MVTATERGEADSYRGVRRMEKGCSCIQRPSTLTPCTEPLVPDTAILRKDLPSVSSNGSAGRNHRATQVKSPEQERPLLPSPKSLRSLNDSRMKAQLSASMWLGVLEAPEGSQDESRTVLTFPGKTRVGKIQTQWTRPPAQAP